jgi:hypothetical protein
VNRSALHNLQMNSTYLENVLTKTDTCFQGLIDAVFLQVLINVSGTLHIHRRVGVSNKVVHCMYFRCAAAATRHVQLRNDEVRQTRPDVISHDTGDEQCVCGVRHHALKKK